MYLKDGTRITNTISNAQVPAQSAPTLTNLRRDNEQGILLFTIIRPRYLIVFVIRLE